MDEVIGLHFPLDWNLHENEVDNHFNMLKFVFMASVSPAGLLRVGRG